MIHGVGIDVVDISRVERLLAGSARFGERWFTDLEVSQCLQADTPAAAYAERLAAKEAVWKALRIENWAGGVPWALIGTSVDAGEVRVQLAGRVAHACPCILPSAVHASWASSAGRSFAIAMVECAGAVP